MEFQITIQLDYGVTIDLTSDEIENPIITRAMIATTTIPARINGHMIDI